MKKECEGGQKGKKGKRDRGLIHHKKKSIRGGGTGIQINWKEEKGACTGGERKKKKGGYDGLHLDW